MKTTYTRLSHTLPAVLICAATLLSATAHADNDGDDYHGSKLPSCTQPISTAGTTTGTTIGALQGYRVPSMPSGHRLVNVGDTMPAGHLRTAYGAGGTVFSLTSFPDALAVYATTPTTAATTGTGTTTATNASNASNYVNGQLEINELQLTDERTGKKHRYGVTLELVPGSSPPVFRLKSATEKN